MNPKFLLPTLALLVFSSVSEADEADTERLKQLDREIAELEGERARLLETMPAPAAVDSGGLFDAQGQVNPKITDSVVIIEGDKSVGTGFIGSVGGKKYVYTAAHVFSGNSKLSARNSSGASFRKFGVLEAAEGADLVRMEILEEVKNSLEFRPAEPPLQINRKIAALGNGGGNGVVSVEQGLVLGTSADSLEIDAAIIQGNSGGPVVEVETGRVVGLATHLTLLRNSTTKRDAPQEKVRRFACRLDKEWKWKSMKIGAFLESSEAVDRYKALNDVCLAIMAGLPEYGGSRVRSIGSNDPAIQKILSDNQDHEMVKAYRSMFNEMLGGKSDPSTMEIRRRFGILVSTLISRAIQSENSLKPETYAWFHRDRAMKAIVERKECLVELNRELQKLK
ncbi:trypsin-like peptidase domain-containing protein [Luteolibacter yonseiensis]|uniref:Trypsin-like peptidase domain-containing protein n=1 Tax=Luteolibacter yonseiensis TaxID=1144680 RepID=A0A934R5B8_9BACT|nr:serine protease [Luteolibacter yonseiensis]MBK1815449.1 trypsin-like peptidase domain-containing protein [Luteolibacter yonseiensis]